MEPDKNWHVNSINFWNKVNGLYNIPDELFSVLIVACQSLDVYSRAMDRLQTEGLTIEDKSGNMKNHPCNEICSKAINGFLRAVKQLGITVEDEQPKRKPGRPARGI